ncbi:cobalamin synthase [Stutzerimonas stutzeri]|uniref:adenosylcobinamide-GDP ribazoletransferase n=1 Tax=Stutzerimonas stutzeri subgroup TaxID=578833 RepID=UPI000C6D35C9|nr:MULTISPECIES: adenosylcobinamide-GDP ribazoletransferase [Stutzerimonas stutzeri subgroup]MCQ2047583.1 adenosylcobinamide-GDP ribazoletransferase [Stutzerimonas kunmingensis]PKR29025.1 adenosylcobinamide-GDP ribazoletransferase [Stutzerimonas stutzeri]QQC12823.1 adenosylcobinamide-GDP ribazoletransferase [Stutzerimonas stutzeri]VEI36153.1 cobalamin synthase [Stutzerimonas stutzeri]
MLPLLIALQFLTSLPIRLPAMPEPEQQGRSLLYYPVVGLLLGALLCLAAFVLDGAAPLLQAALLLTLWVALTGGLHLDGLADSADAWLGGFGDRERTLQIMKDPRSGPVAVVVLVLLLLLKFSALLALLQAQQYSALLLAPVLGRAALPALFLLTPYVRPNGLGHALAANLPHGEARGVLALVAVGCLLFGSGLVALSLAAVTFMLARRAMLRRLGGTTGDTAGALLELVECTVLVGLALQL